MQELQFSHASSDPAHSSVPSRVAATDRTLRTAEVISLDEVRAIFRPRAPEASDNAGGDHREHARDGGAKVFSGRRVVVAVAVTSTPGRSLEGVCRFAARSPAAPPAQACSHRSGNSGNLPAAAASK